MLARASVWGTGRRTGGVCRDTNLPAPCQARVPLPVTHRPSTTVHASIRARRVTHRGRTCPTPQAPAGPPIPRISRARMRVPRLRMRLRTRSPITRFLPPSHAPSRAALRTACRSGVAPSHFSVRRDTRKEQGGTGHLELLLRKVRQVVFFQSLPRLLHHTREMGRAGSKGRRG